MLKINKKRLKQQNERLEQWYSSY